MALSGVSFSDTWLDAENVMKPFSCANANVSYDNRVDDPTHYNFCTVPDSSYDAVLFVATALLVATAASVRMSALNVLVVGRSPISEATCPSHACMGCTAAPRVMCPPFPTCSSPGCPGLLMGTYR